jgi:nicotinamide-nucleotide adenylyltransferase
VRGIEFHERSKFQATEIRGRVLRGEDWSDLVPPSVCRIVKEIDGEERIRDLAKNDKAPPGVFEEPGHQP